MELKNPMLIVENMDRSIAFYQQVLGLQVILDFGANKTLTGGLVLQTAETYKSFIAADSLFFGGNDFELYFEEAGFDAFVEHLRNLEIAYVHPVMEHSWGQRVVRIYDPDYHIIEVGEPMKTVCKRFLESGMTLEETAKRMDVPLSYVQSML